MGIRKIVFRAKRTDSGEWVYGSLIQFTDVDCIIVPEQENLAFREEYEVCPDTIGQYTGLKNKSNNICIFEGDILSLSGILIGNKYENEGLLKDGTNLLIDGLCTKEWLSTYQEAIKRGCINAK